MTFSQLKSNITKNIAPYRDVLGFVIILLCTHFAWKFTVIGDEHGGAVSWFGLDITAPFDFMANHIATVCYTILSWFKDTISFDSLYTLRYDNGNSVKIVWACTAIKQGFIFCCIILFSRGKIRDKLWFIPLGWIFVYVFNILRITLISAVIENHPEWFTFLHEYLLKYIFYGMIFLLWVWWTEKISKQTPAKQSEKQKT